MTVDPSLDASLEPLPHSRNVASLSVWSSLPIECFPLTYDLNDFKSRVYTQLHQCDVKHRNLVLKFQTNLLYDEVG